MIRPAWECVPYYNRRSKFFVTPINTKLSQKTFVPSFSPCSDRHFFTAGIVNPPKTASFVPLSG